MKFTENGLTSSMRRSIGSSVLREDADRGRANGANGADGADEANGADGASGADGALLLSGPCYF